MTGYCDGCGNQICICGVGEEICVETIIKERDEYKAKAVRLTEVLDKMRPPHSITCHPQKCADYCLVAMKNKTLEKYGVKE